MPKKFKRWKPRKTTGTASLVPVVYLTEEAVKNLNDARFHWRERFERGQELVLLEATGLMMEAVQKLAPDEVGGVKDYAKSLKVAVVSGRDESVVSIILPEVKRELTEDDQEDTVVYVRAGRASPQAAKVLEAYNPWPAALLPFQPTGRGVSSVSRQVSRSEVSRASARILSKRSSIESQLRRAGVRDAEIRRSNRGTGTEVHDDLAFSVLRREFGLADKSEPHWRPAVKLVQRSLQQLGEKLVEYVMTGKESVFSLPPHVSVSASEVTTFEPFQDKIASATGLKT
jgi:hypothetical protein